jgi:NDP-sugar pyrophosphorylase family protein
MLNIVFPMGGGSNYFEGQPFPKPLIEILGKSMIQRVIENYDEIKKEKQYIFIVSKKDCAKYHIDQSLKILTGNTRSRVIQLDSDTKGAACSVMMAIEHINNEDPLIIANSDQFFNGGLKQAVDFFQDRNADAGVICMETVHPRWSYVRLDDNGKVVETAEKRPLSKNAIAGFYYFAHGRDFVKAAMDMILKDNNLDGNYYVAPAINELILEGKDIQIFMVDNDKYHTFYSPEKIKEFEQKYYENTRSK